MSHAHRYEMLVAAEAADEAIEVAAEALPPGAEIIESTADSRGAGVWFVVLRYRSPRAAESRNAPE